MNDTGVMTPRTHLGMELRNVIVEYVGANRLSVDDLAETLQVHSDAVHSLLGKAYWDVELGLQLVEQLRVPFRVISG